MSKQESIRSFCIPTTAPLPMLFRRPTSPGPPRAKKRKVGRPRKNPGATSADPSVSSSCPVSEASVTSLSQQEPSTSAQQSESQGDPPPSGRLSLLFMNKFN